MDDSVLLSKRCPRCREDKAVSEFYTVESRKDGYTSYCKRCMKVYGWERRNNPEKFRTPERSRTLEDGTTIRRCGRCDEFKEIGEFGRTVRTKDGYGSYCRDCRAEYKKNWTKREYAAQYNRRRKYAKYGLTTEAYETMRAEQDGRCAICMQEQEGDMYIDHCHEEGHVRGLLCFSCNVGLGHFSDDPGVLRAAAEYIEGFR